MTTQRLQMDSALDWIPESAPGVIGSTGVRVPLAAESGYAISQEPVPMPIGMADRLPDSLVAGLIMAGGALPVGLDYEFIGNPLRSLWTGYARATSGTGSLHEFFEDLTYGARPKTFALEGNFLEPTAQHIVGRNNLVSGLDFRGDFQGGAQLAAQILGTGDTDETATGVTVTNHGFQASSYFDGRIRYKVSGVEHDVAGFTALSCSAARPMSREEGGFLAGEANAVNFGPITMKGEMGVPMNVGGSGPFADINFYSDATNRRVVGLDYLVADGPLLTCTKYLRWQIFCAFVFRQNPKPAPGVAGVKYSQRFETARMSPTLTVSPASYHAPLESTYRGPFTVPASAKLGVKLNGGATIPIDLTAGAGKTIDNLVTDINANVTFAALAAADNFLGVIRLRTLLGGSTKSIQIDVAQADTFHASLGFNGTARAGRSSIGCRMTLYDLLNADF